MNIIKNEKMIQRNARIGSTVTLISLVTLGIGMYITFAKPELLNLSIIALLIGFLLSQVGIYYTNRWGRNRAPDEMLDQALKGLDSHYSLYHYKTPAAHVLIGPGGIWNLIPKHQRGTIVYSKNRWRQKGGGILQGYLRLFAQEGIGRPELEIETDVDRLTKFFRKKFPDVEIPTIGSALVFFHPEVELDVEEAPSPTLLGKKLKDFIRKNAKTNSLAPEIYESFQKGLEN